MFERPYLLAQRFMQTGVFWMGIIALLRATGFVFVLPIVLKKIPSDEVGLWYVFGGIAGVCSMIELGFASNISRFTAFYLAGFKELPSLRPLDDRSTDHTINQAGLIGLIRMATQLYLAFACTVLILMFFGGGGWLLCKYQSAILQPKNLFAYIMFIFGTAWSIANYFWIVMLPASNRIIEAQKLQLGGMLINYSITFLGVFLHWGIMALILGQLGMTIYLRQRSRVLFNRYCPLDTSMEPMPIRWTHLWPMTWRGGLMSLGIYLNLPVTTLVCAQLFDLKTTASYAISLQLTFMAYTVANSWLLVKYPLFSTHYVQGNLVEIRKILVERLSLQMLSYVILCAGAWQFAPLLLHYVKSGTNFLSPGLLLLLMVSGGVDLFVHSISASIQNGNKFPFIYSMLLNGVLCVVLAFVLGKWFGLAGLVCAPFAAQLLFNGWYIMVWSWRDLHRKQAANGLLPNNTL